MRSFLLTCLFLPSLILGQQAKEGLNPQETEASELQATEGSGQQATVGKPSLTFLLADSLAVTNQIHGPYVGFSGERTAQYRRFETLTEQADCKELLELSNHSNAVVRGYAFWGLARKHYSGLDSLLMAHAHDEAPVVEIQGGVMNQIPLIEFMLWVVNPDMMDAESLKLDRDTFRQVTELRFSEE